MYFLHGRALDKMSIDENFRAKLEKIKVRKTLYTPIKFYSKIPITSGTPPISCNKSFFLSSSFATFRKHHLQYFFLLENKRTRGGGIAKL